MAADRFTRYKILRALWARARALMAALTQPHVREAQARALRWQIVNVAERQIRDGIVRGTGDPDSARLPLATDVRPPLMPARPSEMPHDVSQRPTEWERQRQEWHVAHAQWVEAQQRVAAYVQQRRGR